MANVGDAVYTYTGSITSNSYATITPPSGEVHLLEMLRCSDTAYNHQRWGIRWYDGSTEFRLNDTPGILSWKCWNPLAAHQRMKIIYTNSVPLRVYNHETLTRNYGVHSRCIGTATDGVSATFHDTGNLATANSSNYVFDAPTGEVHMIVAYGSVGNATISSMGRIYSWPDGEQHFEMLASDDTTWVNLGASYEDFINYTDPNVIVFRPFRILYDDNSMLRCKSNQANRQFGFWAIDVSDVYSELKRAGGNSWPVTLSPASGETWDIWNFGYPSMSGTYVDYPFFEIRFKEDTTEREPITERNEEMWVEYWLNYPKAYTLTYPNSLVCYYGSNHVVTMAGVRAT